MVINMTQKTQNIIQTKNKDTGDIEEYNNKINNTRQRKPVDNLSK